MAHHTTNEVIMIKPYKFFSNEQTAVNNVYQHESSEHTALIQQKALKEFESLKSALKDNGITVHVLEDTPEPSTPDSIFPNNWFSTHEDGTMVLYPMFAPNRQVEILKFKEQVKEIVSNRHDITLIDYSSCHKKRMYLEGTGAMVLDRKNKIAYCCLSPRADSHLFHTFCEEMGYEAVAFHAYYEGHPVYHTNVMMGIGETQALICLEAIEDEQERRMVADKLKESGKQVIEISLSQVSQFLGNTLELQGKNAKNILLMSETAYQSLTPSQKEKISKETEILHVSVDTIEYHGGGSVRCMLAEVF